MKLLNVGYPSPHLALI
jgi:hypothetical protein